MTSVVPVLTAILAIVASGTAVLSSVWPQETQNPGTRWFRRTFGILLGLGCWSGSYAATLFLLGASPLSRLGKDILLALAGAVCLVLFRRRTQQPPHQTVRINWRTSGLLLAAIGLAIAIFTLRTLRAPEGAWDAWAIWNLRARFLVRAGNEFAVAFSPDIAWSHPDYPLLLPGLVAQGWLVIGYESVVVPAILAATFALLTVGMLAFGVESIQRNDHGTTTAFLLLGTPGFVALASEQYADVLLSAYVLGGYSLAARYLESDDPRATRLLVLSGLSASMAAWTKNEGIVFGLALIFAMIIHDRSAFHDEQWWRPIGSFALGALPFSVLLMWFKILYAPPNDLQEQFNSALLMNRAMDPGRFLKIAGGVAAELVAFRRWGLFLLAVLGYIVAKRLAGPSPRSSRVLLTGIAMSVVGFLLVYWLVSEDPAWHMRTSFGRLLLQTWPTLLLAVVVQTAPEHKR
jgi:hypothetical protein